MSEKTTIVYASDLALDVHQKEVAAGIRQLGASLDSPFTVILYSGIELFINSNLQALSDCIDIEQTMVLLSSFSAVEKRNWGNNHSKIRSIYGSNARISRGCLDFDAVPRRIGGLLKDLAVLEWPSLRGATYRDVPVGEYAAQDYSYVYKNINPASATELNAYRLLITACCCAIDNFVTEGLGNIKRVIYFNDYCWHMAIRSIAENDHNATAICISNSVSTADRSESIQIRPRHLIEMQLVTQLSWKDGLRYLPLNSEEITKIDSRLNAKLSGTHFTSFTPPVTQTRNAITPLRRHISEYRNAYLLLTSSPDEASGIYSLYKAYKKASKYRDITIPAFDSSSLQQDLITRFLEIAKCNPDDLFMIRVHPRDGACSRYNIRSKTTIEMISKYSASNFIVFDAESDINTYLLAALCTATFTGWSSTCLELNMLGIPSFALVRSQIPLLNTPPELIIDNIEDYIGMSSQMPDLRITANCSGISETNLQKAIIAYRWHACYNFMYENHSSSTIIESLRRLDCLPRKSWALPILEAYYISHAETSVTEERDKILRAVTNHRNLLKHSVQ